MLLRGRYTSAAVPRMYHPNTSPSPSFRVRRVASTTYSYRSNLNFRSPLERQFVEAKLVYCQGESGTARCAPLRRRRAGRAERRRVERARGPRVDVSTHDLADGLRVLVLIWNPSVAVVAGVTGKARATPLVAAPSPRALDEVLVACAQIKQ